MDSLEIRWETLELLLFHKEPAGLGEDGEDAPEHLPEEETAPLFRLPSNLDKQTKCCVYQSFWMKDDLLDLLNHAYPCILPKQ